MTRIAVTGSGGFIGSHLVDKLLSQGNEVIAIDVSNRNVGEPKKNYDFIKCDITDQRLVKKIITEDVDMVYHLSAVVGVKNYCADPLKVLDVNVGGTRNVLEAAMRHNVKFIMASTSEIYGKNPAVPWKEDSDRVLGSPSIDRWSYSTSKSLCEHMLFAVHRTSGLPTVILRYFNVYGPRQAPYFVVPACIKSVLNGQPPLVYDTGNQTRCFTYVSDAVDGTLKAAEHPKAVGDVFNIGSSKESRVKDVVNMVIELAGRKGKLKYKRLDTRAHYGKLYEDIGRRIPDVSKAKKVLGWEAKVPLDEGLKLTIDWCRKNSWWLKSA